MTDEMEEEMSSVCNMGEAIRRKAEAEGMAKGMAKGLETGIAKGLETGVEKGESRLASLMAKLKELGRVDDAFKAAEDKQYREKLYKEFQMA